MFLEIIIIGLSLNTMGCGLKTSSKMISENNKETSEFEVWRNNVKITPDSQKEIVKYLASDELEGRETGSKGIEKAATYITKYFEKNSIPPYFDSYYDEFEANNNGKKKAFNLVGYLEGKDENLKNEYIILSAHYDHIGIINDSDNKDNIANGANDNASGCAAVLEMAKYFAKQNNNQRSMLFILFSAEEIGLQGSEHLAKKLIKEKKLKINTVFNFEMIGVPLEKKDYLAYLTGYHKSNLADKMNLYYQNIKNNEKGLIGFLPESEKMNLFKRSDNYPFYKYNKSISSHTICTFDFTNYEYYHHVGDQINELDFKHMSNLVTKLLYVIEKITNSKKTELETLQLEAFIAMEKGNYQKAIHIYEYITKSYPLNTEACTQAFGRLLRLYIQIGEINKACYTYKKIKQLYPEYDKYFERIWSKSNDIKCLN